MCSASEHDTKLAVSLLEKIQGKFPRLRKILADRGFSCDNLRRFVILKLKALLEIKDNKEEYILKDTEKSVPLKGFQVIPHRWIVERTNAWNIFYRRLAKDYEHNPITSQALIMMSAIKQNLSNLSQKPLLKET